MEQTNLNIRITLYGPRGGVLDWKHYADMEAAVKDCYAYAGKWPGATHWEFSRDGKK